MPKSNSSTKYLPKLFIFVFTELGGAFTFTTLGCICCIHCSLLYLLILKPGCRLRYLYLQKGWWFRFCIKIGKNKRKCNLSFAGPREGWMLISLASLDPPCGDASPSSARSCSKSHTTASKSERPKPFSLSEPPSSAPDKERCESLPKTQKADLIQSVTVRMDS